MKDSIELIFGSKARWRLLKFFMLNENKEFSLKEITNKNKLETREAMNVVNQFLKARLLNSKNRKKSKAYSTNKNFSFYRELKALVVRSNVYPQCDSLTKMKNLGDVKLSLVSGIFINYPKAMTDLLIVGDNFSRAKMKHLLEDLEAEMGREINYSIMTTTEFKYRVNMFDKFITDLIEEPHEIILNKVPNLLSELRNARRS